MKPTGASATGGKGSPMNTQPKRVFQIAMAMAVLVSHCISARSDTVYVWSGDETIKQFTNSGGGSVLASNVTGWNGPVGLALDDAGNLYARCPGNSTITKFTTNGVGSAVGFPVDSVSALAFDCAGNLYSTSPNYMEIDRLLYGGFYGYYSGSPGTYSQSHLSYPTSLAFDKSGDICVANGVYPFANTPYTNTIAKFSPDLTYLGDFATGLDQPWGLAFDQAGNLFVSNSGDNTILIFTPKGICYFFADASSGLSNPKGLAFDSAGNLYVANSGNGTIQKFTPGGLGTVFASGLDSPTSIAIYPGLRFWTPLPKLANPTRLPGGGIQFSFAYTVGTSFSALGSTNLSLPPSNWTVLGGVTEVSPGHFQFTDVEATNNPQRFYRVRSH